MKRIFRSGISVVAAAVMSAFAASGQDNSIKLAENASPVEYNPMIFGHFIEHFSTQVYGGIFDPGNPLSDEDGFRKDVIEALREIKAPIVRWPGGCFVSTYHWMGGVGPVRTPVFDKSWGVEDPNTFGTDEYVKWCRKVGCEPYICTNAGTGTPEEMSDWVEYCNLNYGKFGRLRAENGHPEPYGVKYWSVGNENYGSWELGARTVDEWGPYVCESSKLMRSVTKDLKLLAAANSNRDWTLPLLRKAGWQLDFVSIHGYWDFLTHENNPAPYLKCMMYTDDPEQSIMQTIDIIREAGCDDHIKIAYDEWNLRSWHHPGHGRLREGFDVEARKKNDINSTYTMADAVFSACFFNACLRHADYVEMACISPCVNTRGPIYAYRDGLLKRSTYHTIWMYVNLLEKNVMPLDVKCGRLEFGDDSVDEIDAVLTVDDAGGRYALVIANKDPETAVTIALDAGLFGGKIPSSLKSTVLNGNGPDDYNEVGAENHIVPREKRLSVGKRGLITVEPHSVTVLNWQTGK